MNGRRAALATAAYVLPAAGLLVAMTMPARADGEIAVRRGEHPSFSRLVFVLPEAMPFSMTRRENGVTLGFPGAGRVPDAQAGGRIQAVVGGAGVVSITLQPGKVFRVWHVDKRVVVDVLDPVAASSTAASSAATGASVIRSQTEADRAASNKASNEEPAAATPLAPIPRAAVRILAVAPLRRARAPGVPFIASSMSVAASPEPVLATPLDPPPVVAPAAAAAASLPGPVPVPAAAAAADNGGAIFAASLLPAEAGWPSGAVLLPFGAEVGAAAFRRGGEANVVFDTAQLIDLGMLRNDPVYGGLAVTLLPTGTHLHFTLPATSQLRLDHGGDGWRIGIVPEQAGRPPITAHADPGVLKLLAGSPSRVVVLGDPATGGRLLTGTQRQAGQPWMAPYVSAEFAVLPTWQGVLVQPAADRAVLRVSGAGFDLGADGGPPLSMPTTQAGQDAAGSVVMTRRFDLPPLPPAAWRSRLQQSWQDAAAAPKLGRFGARLRAAQAMIALGLNAEAGTMLKAAQADDPARAADLDVAALTAMADWRAGRSDPAELARLDDPGLTGTDEISLWRALMHGDAADAAMPAAAAAAVWKLVGSYPTALREALLPPLAALLARGGKTDALRAMLLAFPGKPLDPARAALLASDGKTDAALALYARLAGSADRQDSSRARRAATELALATKRIDARTAAGQLSQQLYAWRGGPQDVELRMRLAALQGQTGQWRAGLALLRETEPLFPELHQRLHDAERGLVAELIRGSAADRMAPLDLVALADECAGLLAEDGADAKLAPVLAAKLEALDLPERAEPVLQHVLDRTSAPGPKAEVGLRLAEIRLDLRGGRAALATLDASEAPDLPAPLAADRALLRARAMAANGDPDSALHLLDGNETPQALDFRATLLERRHDWPAAEAALASFARLTIPASGALTPAQQNVLVHLASLATQAADAAELQSLRLQQAGRISTGPAAELFQLLTETPVRGVADITRSGQELISARATPAALASLRDR